jgi:hypothetical protein
MNKIKSNGYIALISIIIIGAIILLSAISLTFVALSQTQIMIGQNQKLFSYYLANACAHYGLNRLRTNPAYLGNEKVTFDNYICQIEPILANGQQTFIIYTNSNVNNYLSRIKVDIGQLKPRTIIKYWGEAYN